MSSIKYQKVAGNNATVWELAGMPRYSFRLFVSDIDGPERAAIENLQSLCAIHLQHSYEISVIDVRRRPELAQRERILATPALVRVTPLPRQCVVGDLADSDEVLRALARWVDNGHTHPPNDSAAVCKPR